MKYIDKYLWKTTLLTIMAMVLSACGGGGSGGDMGSNPNSTPPHGNSNRSNIAIVSCNTSTNTEAYTATQSGDLIQKDQENTTIKIYHSQDNEKYVCVKAGKAHIARK